MADNFKSFLHGVIAGVVCLVIYLLFFKIACSDALAKILKNESITMGVLTATIIIFGINIGINVHGAIEGMGRLAMFVNHGSLVAIIIMAIVASNNSHNFVPFMIVNCYVPVWFYSYLMLGIGELPGAADVVLSSVIPGAIFTGFMFLFAHIAVSSGIATLIIAIVVTILSIGGFITIFIKKGSILDY